MTTDSSGDATLTANGATVILRGVQIAALDADDILANTNGPIGGNTDDTINGTAGADTLDGGDGDDTVNGDAGDDQLSGSDGEDELNGGAGNDSLFGGNGTDVLNGDAGNDTLQGDKGGDFVNGADGDDKIIWNNGDGSDRNDGGAGTDSLEVRAETAPGGGFQIVGAVGGEAVLDRLTANPFTLTNSTIERIDVFGGDGVETLFLNDLAGTDVGIVGFNGGASNDIADAINGNISLEFEGGVGNDTALGGNAADVMNGGEGADSLQGFSGDDILDGGVGDDFLTGGAGADQMEGGDGNDFLNGGGDNDFILGGAGDDRLFGIAGNDRIVGGAGDDSMEGGDGDDTFVYDSGADVITDFVAGVGIVDVIDLTAFNFTNISTVLALTTDTAGGARVNLSAVDTLLLEGVAKADLDADDFLI
jgi:Ca2+-binding RTX toxin-like protein